METVMLMVMTTCFVRILIVLALLRQAIGTQAVPPAQVVTGLAAARFDQVADELQRAIKGLQRYCAAGDFVRGRFAHAFFNRRFGGGFRAGLTFAGHITCADLNAA